MADERIKLELDLNQFTASAKEGTHALQTMHTVADQNVVPALKKVDDAAQQAAAAKRNFGSTVLYASYAVQDFTSQLGTRGLAGAFAAIQNNIPQILVGLGVGGGLTGILSVAAVALGAFSDKLIAMPEDAKKAADALKDLKEKADKLRESPSTKEKEIAGTFGEYMQGIDRKQVSSGIEETLASQETVKLRQTLGYLAKQEMIPGTDAYNVRMMMRGGKRRDVEAELEKEMATRRPGITRKADEMLVGLAKGDQGAIDSVSGMAEDDWAGLFPKGLASDLRSFSPASEKAADAEEERVQAFGERARKGSAARRQRRAQTEGLTRAGQVNESAMWRAGQVEADQGINQGAAVADALTRKAEQDQQRAEAEKRRVSAHGADARNRMAAGMAVRQVQSEFNQPLTGAQQQEAQRATVAMMQQGVSTISAAVEAVRTTVQRAEMIRAQLQQVEQNAIMLRQHNNSQMGRTQP
jgi:hypothetical protein